ncbi:MAG TPA: biopolymer transporter ExbD [Brevundimonas sp.]|uniref:ExbD/TolR family protein n=1 Tax=Brevundimonas sp. TaxID=1871086 RepID=UPI002CD5D61B|nr:biopolymer transporter ExbD [Brevundimonas sp.]HRH20694.1 biopolymer transporter ExbD [Brevundimonas sp.]
MPVALKSSIDLTPIIGLLLTLIVAMLFAAPMFERSATLDQPSLTAPPGTAPPAPPAWRLSMDRAGALWLAEGDEVPRLTSRHEVMASVAPNTRINLRADADASYGDFAELVSQLEASGHPVALANEDIS